MDVNSVSPVATPNASNMNNLKKLSKEEFLKLQGATEELYNNLHKSKSGFIKIHRITGNPYSISGHTEAFGEGIALYVKNSSEWWTTSNITYINWEEGWFDTLNSRYNFTFKEDKNEN